MLFACFVLSPNCVYFINTMYLCIICIYVLCIIINTIFVFSPNCEINTIFVFSSNYIYPSSTSGKKLILILKWINKKTSHLISNSLNQIRGASVDFAGGSDGKESAYSAGDTGSVPGLGRSPGEGNGNPLQCSCQGNPTDRGAWWVTICGVAKSRTWLSD